MTILQQKHKTQPQGAYHEKSSHPRIILTLVTANTDHGHNARYSHNTRHSQNTCQNQNTRQIYNTQRHNTRQSHSTRHSVFNIFLHWCENSNIEEL